MLSTTLRDRLAMGAALLTVIGLCAAFLFSKGTQVLMPGPLTSAHGTIEACSACHTNSGSGKLSWVHGLVAGDPLADSKACLVCHKMPDTAFNAHGAAPDVLKRSTERLTKIAAQTPVPYSARVQTLAFPNHDMAASGLSCATCHQEHQGLAFNLNTISNEQCRSCHVVKFNSFDGDHPKFEAYPFKRRTPIIYDHAGHFGKHYPELAKKDPAKRIPETCSTCHDSRGDKRLMAVAPFEKTCATCHLDQIVGKERATGPKGIAFLSLPGLDLDALRTKKAAIGEWPDGSEAELTPFMKVMIGRNAQGRALIKAIDGLNLQDLSRASQDQIKGVTDLVWEIKRLFHALIKGKASDVLGDLNIVRGGKLSPGLVADLTASIPRDVVASAHQEWLPNLAQEIASGPIVNGQKPAVSESSKSPDARSSEPESADAPPGWDAPEASASPDPAEQDDATADIVKRDPPPCLVRIFGQCMMSKDQEVQPAKPSGAGEKTDTATPSSGGALPQPMRAGLAGVGPAAEPDAASLQAAAKGGDQSDDLLFPTEEELRALKDRDKGGTAAKPDGSTPSAPGLGAASGETTNPTQKAIAPVIAIESDVDPESWAEYGGWYRQDYTIFYRPTGHKDKFLYSWLFLTGPQVEKDDTRPAAAVFGSLTGKDAQGACTKCHSIDDIQGQGRVVNFSPPSVEDKRGRFTRFIHEPHFGVIKDRGCLTCHSLEQGRSYLKSYEQGNPQTFTSGFSAVKKDLCQTCHTRSMARQDCLLCHDYHVNGMVTPMISTKLPVQ